MDNVGTRAVRGKQSRIILGVAITIAALLGFGIGSVVADEPEADLTESLGLFQTEWFAAWNEADGDAIRSMMAPGGRHYCPGSGIDGVSGDDLAAFVAKGFTVTDVATVGAMSMSTPGAASENSQDHLIVTEHTLDGHPGYLSVLHLRGPEDSLQVLSHRAFP